jgi:riboflavin synthase
MRLEIGTHWPDTAAIPLGASIACAGCCLTVVDRGDNWFAADVSAETLACTTLGGWAPGSKVNLERALRMGDELGGHIVSGHVDGIGHVRAIVPENGSRRITVGIAADLARFVAAKGSVTVDGVSLTVNYVCRDGFAVNIIPHTEAVTGLGGLLIGDPVNIEIDMLARYVARLTEYR